MRQLILNIRPPIASRLDNFVPGDNADLLAALHQLLTQRESSILYLWGAPGSGRTHLLQAAITAVGTAQGQLIAAEHWQTPSSAADMLIAIDNVHLTPTTAQDELFRTLIHSRELRTRLLITGNTPAHHLPIRDDISSRIAQGLSFEIKPLSDPHKAATLHSHAHARGMNIGPEVINYLLHHGRRDLPWLMAVLDALDEASLSLARPVTLPLLREILKDSTTSSPTQAS